MKYCRFLIATTLLCLLTPAAQAQFGELRMQFQLPQAATDYSLGKGNSCAKVFKSIGKANFLLLTIGDGDTPKAVEGQPNTFSVDGAFKVDIQQVPIDRPSAIQQRFFENAMKQWRDHGYNDRQVELLRSINDQLPPHRVSWISFKFDRQMVEQLQIPREAQGISSIRVFDGSTPLTKSMGHHVRYHDVNKVEDPNHLTEALTPIELSPKNKAAGYQLPFRPQGLVRPMYLWHIGIGTNVKRFNGGLLVMFRHVAEALENNYNKAYFKTFGSTQPLRDIDMHVVSSAKSDLVPYYESLGFDVLDPYTGQPASAIFTVNSKGEAKAESSLPKLPDGMILIGMKADKFVEKFFGFNDVPHIKVEDANMSYELGRGAFEKQREDSDIFIPANREAQASITPITTKAQLAQTVTQLHQLAVSYSQKVKAFAAKYPEVHQMTNKEHRFFAGNKDYAELLAAYRFLATEIYRGVVGMDKSLRTSEWELMESTAVKMLTDFAITGYASMKPGPTGKSIDVIEAMELSLR